MATDTEVKKAVAVICGSKPATNLENVLIASYVLALSPIPSDILARLTVFFVRQPGPYMPDSGTIYQKALELMDDQPAAEDAWPLVRKVLRGREVDLPSRAAAVLAQMGGRRCEALQDTGKEDWNRKAFCELYQAATVRDRERAAIDPARSLPKCADSALLAAGND